MDIYFYRIISSKAPLFEYSSPQEAVKYQPDRYELFLSLDTLDQVLRLPTYVSFLRSGPRGRLPVNLVPIDARTKNCETHPRNEPPHEKKNNKNTLSHRSLLFKHRYRPDQQATPGGHGWSLNIESVCSLLKYFWLIFGHAFV